MKLEIYGIGKDNATGKFEIRTTIMEVVPEGFGDEFLLEGIGRMGIELEIRVPQLNGIWVKGKLKIK